MGSGTDVAKEASDNVVTNGIADGALAFEPGERAVSTATAPGGEGALHRRLIERLVIVGVWLSAGTLAVFWWQWLDLATWVVATLVAATAIVVNELHKRLRAPQRSRHADHGTAV